MVGISLSRIKWITSAKPEIEDSAFEESNILLYNFTHQDCDLLVVNSTAESEIILSKNLRCETLFVESERPSIHDLLSCSDTEFTILSNSDVRLYARELITNNLKSDVALHTLRRFDIEDFSGINSYETANTVSNHVGFHQSRFTLDLFIIGEEFKNHLLEQKWTHQFSLGQAGVDMRLLKDALLYGNICRIDQRCRLLHKNHERFKVAHSLNIICDLVENKKFSDVRKTKFSGEAVSLLLTYFPFSFRKIKVFRKLISSLDIRLVKMYNKFQYLWSRLNHKLYVSYTLLNIKCTMIIRRKLWLIIPSKSAELNVFDSEAVKKYVSDYQRKVLSD